MYLVISLGDLKGRSAFEYIAVSIEKRFPDSKADADLIRSAKSNKEVKRIFNDYYEGWKYDGVEFQFDEIDNILYWMNKEVELYRKEIEYKKWLEWLDKRGLTPGMLSKGRPSNKKSS